MTIPAIGDVLMIGRMECVVVALIDDRDGDPAAILFRRPAGTYGYCLLGELEPRRSDA